MSKLDELMCVNHNKKLAKNFCTQCNQFLCNKCVIEKHGAHFPSIETLSDLLSKLQLVPSEAYSKGILKESIDYFSFIINYKKIEFDFNFNKKHVESLYDSYLCNIINSKNFLKDTIANRIAIIDDLVKENEQFFLKVQSQILKKIGPDNQAAALYEKLTKEKNGKDLGEFYSMFKDGFEPLLTNDVKAKFDAFIKLTEVNRKINEYGDMIKNEVVKRLKIIGDVTKEITRKIEDNEEMFLHDINDLMSSLGRSLSIKNIIEEKEVNKRYMRSQTVAQSSLPKPDVNDPKSIFGVKLAPVPKKNEVKDKNVRAEKNKPTPTKKNEDELEFNPPRIEINKRKTNEFVPDMNETFGKKFTSEIMDYRPENEILSGQNIIDETDGALVEQLVNKKVTTSPDKPTEETEKTKTKVKDSSISANEIIKKINRNEMMMGQEMEKKIKEQLEKKSVPVKKLEPKKSIYQASTSIRKKEKDEKSEDGDGEGEGEGEELENILKLYNEGVPKEELAEKFDSLPLTTRNMLEILYPVQSSSKIRIYSPLILANFEMQIESSFPSNFAMLNVLPYLYISGGKEKNTELNTLTRYRRNSPSSIEIISLPPLKDKRSNHTMVYVPIKNVICFISGTKLKTCEMYNIKEKKMSSMPLLNSSRERACTCVINDKILYTFFGFDRTKSKFVTTIEKINIERMIIWEVISIPGNQNILKKQSIGWLAYTHEGKEGILITGGINSLRNECQEVLYFDVKRNTVNLFSCSLPTKASFCSQAYLQLGLKEQYFNVIDDGNLISYNSKENKFKNIL